MNAVDVESPKKGLSGWTVFGIFVAFFAVVILVNGAFLYFALGSHSGVVTERPYEKGLAYNERLEKAQALPDWRSDLVYEGGVLRLNLMDEAGKALVGAKIAGRMVRPVAQGSDFDFVLMPAGSGVYEASFDVPHKGLWNVQLKGTWQDKTYLYTQEIIVE